MTCPPAPVRRTLSEIGATCLKAARGSGCPWGLAEEAGMAARTLESHGLPGAATLAKLLQGPRACPCTGMLDAPACGISELAALSDAVGALDPVKEHRTGAIAGPILLAAPLILDARRSGRAYELTMDEGRILCTPAGINTETPAEDWPAVANTVLVRQLERSPANTTPPRWFSREVDSMCWAELERRAGRTLVPESENSRLSGAGPDASNTD